MAHPHSPKTVLITGANGYIGNAVARAFVRAGYQTYGLVRSTASATALQREEITPIVASIDDVASHASILEALPPTIDIVVSNTEDFNNYARHSAHTTLLFKTLAASSAANGVTPLVIFSSGCKDYGTGALHGSPALAPHTESSPLNPPERLAPRTKYALEFFEHRDAFPAVVLRPTNVYGRTASLYRAFFEVGKAIAAGEPLLVPSSPDTVCHALHVDDCAEAYVAIAEHPRRGEVEGQIFNISARRYETLDDIVRAMAGEYGITAGVKYVDGAEGLGYWPPMLIDFSQWTGSEKLRALTGWRDVRPLFTEAFHTYRMAYEAGEA